MSEIGAFRITSESGVASGVRRIVAITGAAILERLDSCERTISRVSETLKTKPDRLLQKSIAVSMENKSLKREIEEIRKADISSEISDMISSGRKIGNVTLITREFNDYGIDDLRNVSDEIKAKASDSDNVIAVLAAVNGEKVTLLVSVSDPLLDKGYHAGKMIKKLAKSIGGGGGGKADMAQVGGKDLAEILKAFELAEKSIS